MYYLYILKCNDGSLYTGITPDIDERLAKHQSGKGSKYVRSRLPIELVYTETHPDKSSAAKREYAVKKLSRAKKLKLIQGG